MYLSALYLCKIAIPTSNQLIIRNNGPNLMIRPNCIVLYVGFFSYRYAISEELRVLYVRI